jgi:hypothetical protein
MIIAKTDMILKAEDYDKWYALYQSMINSGFLMADGKFTLYNLDKSGKLERISDEYGN